MKFVNDIPSFKNLQNILLLHHYKLVGILKT